jgi:MraZ protein
VTLLAKLL